MNQVKDMCRWCGAREGIDPHHLFRRSQEKGIIDDPNNIVKLCRRCHDYATNVKSFEVLLQTYFFLKPTDQITLESIAEVMQKGEPMAPADVSRYRQYLAGEFFFLSEQIIEVEKQYPKEWEKLRKTVSSDRRADMLFEQSDIGVDYATLKLRMKSVEKMLSALKSILEVYIKEGQNVF